jgi:DNA polymerase III epsilon subunit-like protein
MYLNTYIAIDTETGGLFSVLKKEATLEVAITEIALVAVDNETLTIKAKDSWLIAPYSPDLIYDPGAERASGISKKMCEKEGIDLEIVYNNTKEFLIKHTKKSQKPIIILQNKDFDIPFISGMFKIFEDDLFKYIDRVEDTMEWSRLKWPTENKHSLGVISERCGLDHTQAHRALPDTIITANVWIYFMKHLRGQNGAITEEPKPRFRSTFKF